MSVEELAPPEAVPAPPPPRPTAAPVAEGERFGTVDAIRGLALLGILVMNIPTFAWPGSGDSPRSVYYEPAEFDAWKAGGPEPSKHRIAGDGWADAASRNVSRVFFQDKMRGLFTMLFGAGLVLFADRASTRRKRPFWLFFRRIAVLALFGAIHGYFFWTGDILFLYACVGLWCYPFRKMAPGRLVTLALAQFGVQLAMVLGMAALASAVDFRSMETVGKIVKDSDAGLLGRSLDSPDGFRPDPSKGAEEATKNIRRLRSSDYLEQFRERAKETAGFQGFSVLAGFLFSGWLMLLGMALMKVGFFQGQKPDRVYWRVMTVGYALGLPMTIVSTVLAHRWDEDISARLFGPAILMLVATPMLSLAHASAVILMMKGGILSGLTTRLAAVGRMALTNYLLETLICTTLFYGYGVGLYGRVPMWGLMAITFAIWCLLMVLSPWWLARFKFGPMEWLWRTLTYWKLQPMRRLVTVSAPEAPLVP